MKIAMLARNANLYSHQRLVEAALARGHEIDILNTLRVTMNITSHRPEAYYQGAKLGKYDAVIPRIGASITFYGLAVLRQFEMMNVWSLNESVAIGRSRDKLRSLQILARKGLGLPVTAFAHDPKQTDEVIKMVGGAPVVITSFNRTLARSSLGISTPTVFFPGIGATMRTLGTFRFRAISSPSRVTLFSLKPVSSESSN